jgi:hypothetical protein
LICCNADEAVCEDEVSDDGSEYTISSIVNHEGDILSTRNKVLKTVVCEIHWKGYPLSETTWQEYETVANTEALDNYKMKLRAQMSTAGNFNNK